MKCQPSRQTGVSRLGAIVAGLVLVSSLAAGCGNDDPDDGSGSGRRVKVVAAFGPLAWLAEAVGGSSVVVSNLTPVGAEPHDLELSPDQVARILSADVVLVVGGGFQPAVEDAASQSSGARVVLADELIPNESDLHFWLDPALMRRAVASTRIALADAAPTRADEFAARSQRLLVDIDALDQEFVEGLRDCQRREVFTVHDAFGRLASRYDLEAIPIGGATPESEPSAQRLADIIEAVRAAKAEAVFREPLAPNDVAATVAREVGGIDVLVLDPAEGSIDPAEDRAGEDFDYVEVMRANLRALRTGLECR